MFKKLLCRHSWKTHAKKQYTWEENEVNQTTLGWYRPIIEKQSFEENIEVLICEKCGKIIKIKY